MSKYWVSNELEWIKADSRALFRLLQDLQDLDHFYYVLKVPNAANHRLSDDPILVIEIPKSVTYNNGI